MQYNVFGSKRRSNVQGNEENSNRKPVFNKSVSIKRLTESVNIATVKCLLLKLETNTETEMNFRILLIYFFFGMKNVRVGGKILGSVGRSETRIFFCLALLQIKMNSNFNCSYMAMFRNIMR
jgi:hypothetical protein